MYMLAVVHEHIVEGAACKFRLQGKNTRKFIGCAMHVRRSGATGPATCGCFIKRLLSATRQMQTI